jgi:hypothetical protein
MRNITHVDAQNSQEIVNSQGKLIIIEEIFLDIGKKDVRNKLYFGLKIIALNSSLDEEFFLGEVEIRENSKCK